MNRVSFEIGGQRYEFDRSSLTRLGAGGEGIVFSATAGPNRYALKIYHKITSDKIEKIRAAIEVTPSSAIYDTAKGRIVQLAWPQALLFNKRKESIGLVMPYVDLTTALPFLYYTDPVLATSKKHKEPLSLVLKSKVARNLCSLVKSLHDIGHHFIDFKPQNALVYGDSGQVCLVDCDSYSIKGQSRRFPASAYSVEYINPIALVNEIPPEKLGEDQDNWAVAVALFKLFNLGTHPYSGIISPSISSETIDQNVKMGLYAYGRTSHPLISPRKMSVHHLLPDEMRGMFDRAFSHASTAPKMDDWVSYFDSIINQKLFKRCDKYPNDLAHIRFDGLDCITCCANKIKANFRPASSTSSLESSSYSPSGGSSVAKGGLSASPILKSKLPTAKKKPNLWPIWVAGVLFLVWFLNRIPGPSSTKTITAATTYPSTNVTKPDQPQTPERIAATQAPSPSLPEWYVSVFSSEDRVIGLSFQESASYANKLALEECERQTSLAASSCFQVIVAPGDCVGISRATNGALGVAVGDQPIGLGIKAEELCQKNGGKDCSPGFETTFCRE